MRQFVVGRLLPALDRIGIVMSYIAMAMIVALISLMLYEVVSRKLFNAPTMWATDISYMSNGTLFLIGAAYTLRRNAHIRIDFLSSHLPIRLQHAVNLAFYLVIFLPALLMTVHRSVFKAWDAWVEDEIETMSAWEPLIWPFLTGITIGVIGLTAQVAIESVRHGVGIVDPKAVPGPSESDAT